MTNVPTNPGPDGMLLSALAAAHAEGRDVGEFVAAGLATLAARLGSSAAVTENRPGSWEAAAIASLLASTVGPDDQDLPAYRGPGGGGGSL
jgi:hypothetical protein